MATPQKCACYNKPNNQYQFWLCIEDKVPTCAPSIPSPNPQPTPQPPGNNPPNGGGNGGGGGLIDNIIGIIENPIFGILPIFLPIAAPLFDLIYLIGDFLDEDDEDDKYDIPPDYGYRIQERDCSCYEGQSTYLYLACRYGWLSSLPTCNQGGSFYVEPTPVATHPFCPQPTISTVSQGDRLFWEVNFGHPEGAPVYGMAYNWGYSNDNSAYSLATTVYAPALYPNCTATRLTVETRYCTANGGHLNDNSNACKTRSQASCLDCNEVPVSLSAISTYGAFFITRHTYEIGGQVNEFYTSSALNLVANEDDFYCFGDDCDSAN